jgi:hypothetical protein
MEQEVKLGPKDEIVTLEVQAPADQVVVKQARKAKKEPGDKSKIKLIAAPAGSNSSSSGPEKPAAGTKASEIIQAPIDSLSHKKDPEEPRTLQKEAIIAGVIVVVLGFIAWPIFGFTLAMAMALIGSVLVIGGTFASI